MRPIFKSSTSITPQLSALVNFSEELSATPNATVNSATDGWDISTWDTSLWDATGAAVRAEDSQWVSIGRTGYAIAPELQITFGGTAQPDAELIGIDATFTVGSLVA